MFTLIIIFSEFMTKFEKYKQIYISIMHRQVATVRGVDKGDIFVAVRPPAARLSRGVHVDQVPYGR